MHDFPTPFVFFGGDGFFRLLFLFSLGASGS